MGGGVFDGTEHWTKPWESEGMKMEELPKVQRACNTCIDTTTSSNAEPCRYCDGHRLWRPSELVQAYLAEKARADKMEAQRDSLFKLGAQIEEKAERFRQALNCDCKKGRVYEKNGEFYPSGEFMYEWKPCPICADTRKEAKGNV